MAWNEPGTGGDNGNKNAGPPELDKVFKDLSNKFASLFGKKNSTRSPRGGSAKPVNRKLFFTSGLGILIVIWLLSGIFIVSPAQRAVVLQFGKYYETVGPGPHWLPRFIRSQNTVNVRKVANYSYSAQMLTKDQNIVDVSVAAQYRIANAKDYLYNLVDADNSVKQAIASALRQVMGNTTLDEVLTSGRAVVRQQVQQQLIKTLHLYHAGIEIADVALQPARAPAEVKAAFDDAIKAQEDEQRYQNQAQAYANRVVPIAQGKAKRILQEAGAYKQKVVLEAKGDVAKFNAIYSVYQNAPTVTKERLYLAAMEKVLQNSSKIFIDDTTANNNLLYLPLDKLIADVTGSKSIDDNEQQLSPQWYNNSSDHDNAADQPNTRPGRNNFDNTTIGQERGRS